MAAKFSRLLSIAFCWWLRLLHACVYTSLVDSKMKPYLSLWITVKFTFIQNKYLMTTLTQLRQGPTRWLRQRLWFEDIAVSILHFLHSDPWQNRKIIPLLIQLLLNIGIIFTFASYRLSAQCLFSSISFNCFCRFNWWMYKLNDGRS